MISKANAATLASLCLLCVLLFSAFLINLGATPLHLWDESRRAVDALDMYVNHKWILNFYDGVDGAWSTKSPILLWMQVLSMKLFGINEFAVRLPSALATCIIGIGIWGACRYYFKNVWIGFIAGSIFSLTYGWIFNHAGRTADYDSFLTLFSFICCWSFFFFCLTRKKEWIVYFFFFLTLAVLIKGVAGMLFLPALFLFAIYEKSLFSLVRCRWTYWGSLFFIATIGGYYALREYLVPGFWNAVTKNELGGRYLNQLENNGLPFLYYTQNLSWRYPYWMYFVLPAFITGFSSYATPNVKKLSFFNLLLVCTFWLIISSSKTKLYWYDLPVYPFLSIQIAWFIFFVWLRLQPLVPNFFLRSVLGVFLFIALIAVPLQKVLVYNIGHRKEWPWDAEPDTRMQGYFLKDALACNQQLENYVFCFDGYSTHLNFYIKQLQLKKSNVRLCSELSGLRAGNFVVISQNHMKQKLEELYSAEKILEKYGCSVYIVRK